MYRHCSAMVNWYINTAFKYIFIIKESYYCFYKRYYTDTAIRLKFTGYYLTLNLCID